MLENNQEVLKNLLHGVFLVREASLRTMDYVLSFGERSSSFIISHVLKQAGIPAAYLDARKIIKTDKNFGNAKVDLNNTYLKIKEFYSQTNEIQVVTGFIGAGKGGLTTTLGRGGSDYTAALLGAGLDAEAQLLGQDGEHHHSVADAVHDLDLVLACQASGQLADLFDQFGELLVGRAT